MGGGWVVIGEGGAARPSSWRQDDDTVSLAGEGRARLEGGGGWSDVSPGGQSTVVMG